MMDQPILPNMQAAPLQAAPQQHGMSVAPPSGFEIWGPSAPPPEAQYQMYGSDFSQVLEIEVLPGMSITAEPGTMLFMTPGMGMAADIGGCVQACQRCCCA